MGRAKDEIMQRDESDSDNWRTRTCTHCGEHYKVNIKTGTNINEDDWCPDCRRKIMDAGED